MVLGDGGSVEDCLITVQCLVIKRTTCRGLCANECQLMSNGHNILRFVIFLTRRSHIFLTDATAELRQLAARQTDARQYVIFSLGRCAAKIYPLLIITTS